MALRPSLYPCGTIKEPAAPLQPSRSAKYGRRLPLYTRNPPLVTRFCKIGRARPFLQSANPPQAPHDLFKCPRCQARSEIDPPTGLLVPRPCREIQIDPQSNSTDLQPHGLPNMGDDSLNIPAAPHLSLDFAKWEELGPSYNLQTLHKPLTTCSSAHDVKQGVRSTLQPVNVYAIIIVLCIS
jgi:hypothetical protein